MEKLLEQEFSEFIDSHKAESIFDNFQSLIRQAYLEGYNAGARNSMVQIVYIVDKKRAKE